MTDEEWRKRLDEIARNAVSKAFSGAAAVGDRPEARIDQTSDPDELKNNPLEAGVVNDMEIREHMAELAEQLASRYDRLWRERTAELDHQWTEKITGIKAHLDVRADQIQGQIRAITDGQSSIANKLSKLEVAEQRTKEEIQDTRVEIKANLRRLETRLDRMEGRIDRVEVRMDRLEVRQDEMKVSLDRFVADHETKRPSLEIGLADQSLIRR